MINVMDNKDRKWHGIRYVVYDPSNKLYEERTIILKAKNSEEALDKGSANAEEYCESLDFKFHYIEEFPILDDAIEEYSEVYSTIRNSNLSPKDYVERFIKTGDEVGMSDTQEIDR